MIKVKFQTRYSYPNTKEFWECIDEVANKYAVDSIDHAIIKRDRVIFQLGYSYGLRLHEILNLKPIDFNFDPTLHDEYSSGSILVCSKKTYNSSDNYRLVYSVFPEATQIIKDYLDTYEIFFKKASILFTTSKGNVLTSNYLCKRFKYFNSLIPPSKKIDSILSLRPMYIADLLRIKGLSQTFINNQIGNNLLNNQLYFHLIPNNTV